MTWEQIIPLGVTVGGSILATYVVIKIAIAKLEKDYSHLKETIAKADDVRQKQEEEHSANMKEVRDDVKAIFRALTKIQVDVAKAHGRDEVLGTIKDVGSTIANAIHKNGK